MVEVRPWATLVSIVRRLSELLVVARMNVRPRIRLRSRQKFLSMQVVGLSEARTGSALCPLQALGISESTQLRTPPQAVLEKPRTRTLFLPWL